MDDLKEDKELAAVLQTKKKLRITLEKPLIVERIKILKMIL